MDKNITIESLIEQVRNLIRYQGHVRYDTPIYEVFHRDVTEFVFANSFDKTEHWNYIQKFLMWQSTQYMINDEANAILTGLENIRQEMLERANGHKDPIWAYIHPTIIKVAQPLFLDRHFSEAVQSAIVEINARIKKIRIRIDGEELDGDTLMRQTFSVNQPKLSFEDNSTVNGKNVQQGYMDIFAGAMKGIRNPNAHENMEIKKDDAVRKLMLTSLLMYKVDEAVAFSGVTE